MSVKEAVSAQYRRIVDKAGPAVAGLAVPKEGWLRTVRTALGMSGPQLARRLGVSRNRVSVLERSEVDGGVSLKSMQDAAQAMGCRFVYAIVPEGSVEEMIERQARLKAQAVVGRAAQHMALEDQSLTPGSLNAETQRVLRNILANPPADFWDEP